MEFRYKVSVPQRAEVFYGEVKVLSLNLVYRELAEHPIKIMLDDKPFGHTLALDLPTGDIRWARVTAGFWTPFGEPLATAAPGIPHDQNPAIVALFKSGMLVFTGARA